MLLYGVRSTEYLTWLTLYVPKVQLYLRTNLTEYEGKVRSSSSRVPVLALTLEYFLKMPPPDAPQRLNHQQRTISRQAMEGGSYYY